MSENRVVPVVVRERERKFDLDPSQPIPQLTGAGPVAAQREPVRAALDAAYFDTDDRRLLRAGVTLRRRTGGADAGWHLKLPADSGARDEVRLPLDAEGQAVPPELAERVRAEAGNQDLVEIAHLRTERYSYELVDQTGRPLAVLTDVHVAGEMAGPVAHLDGWRELEIELAPRTRTELLDTLSEALIGAGARPAHWPSKLRRLLADSLPDETYLDRRSTAGDVVLAYLRAQVDAVRRHDLGVRRNEEDAVHQLRVAMRRLRSAFTSFRRVLDRRRTEQVAAELKWAADVLSDARDMEVLREVLTKELSTNGQRVDVEHAVQALTRHLEQAATDARAAVLDVLNGGRYAALLGSLEALVAEPPFTPRAEDPARDELGRAITRAHRRLAKAVSGLDEVQDGDELDAGLHEVRKKAKQARYTGDAARPAFGRRQRRWRRAAKAIQTTLGDDHDLVQARALLRRLADTNNVLGQDAFVFGAFHERALTRGAALRERFNRQWRETPQPL